MKGWDRPVNLNRVTLLTEGKNETGPVAYWMSRDQRAQDNWALLFAQEAAVRRNVPLLVVFCLAPSFLGATMRQYNFMLRGLEKVESELRDKNIPFYFLQGLPGEEIPSFVERHSIGTLITDFDPLRVKQDWRKSVAGSVTITFYEVDGHNIVPFRIASQKKEYSARTLRPKIHRLLPEYLDQFPTISRQPTAVDPVPGPIDWGRVREGLAVDRTVGEVDWVEPGETAAFEALSRFISHGLERYDLLRNDPNEAAQSDLSPYLHFGQLSAQRVAIEVMKSDVSGTAKEAFLEELIVRRELADNFCFYEDQYDSTQGFPKWGQETLDRHGADPRPYLYSLDELDDGQTHDELWNAAQMEMRKRGKMHGYLRMYWAKKILEWSQSPEDALGSAIYLNDRYELDGRDPNGYAGIAWSMGGLHDRPWAERSVTGMIRAMTYKGCTRKFDIKKYVAMVESMR
jgi:deoxyribodipyrimidine photo-lyase